MADLNLLKRRLNNIISVKEITYAMQVISTMQASKVQKIFYYKKKVQIYFEKLFLSMNLHSSKNNLLNYEDQWLLIFFSEKGFAGSFNYNLLPLLEKYQNTKNIIIVGSNGINICKKLGIKYKYFFKSCENIPSYSCIQPIFNIFKEHNFPCKIKVITNKFVNMFIQEPSEIDFVLTNNQSLFNEYQPIIDIEKEVIEKEVIEKYYFERLYFFAIQNYTGEVSARAFIMKNATENSDTLINEVKKEINSNRKIKITQDLNESFSAYKVLQVRKEI
jgi:ATP synthase F1 gamma subunit